MYFLVIFEKFKLCTYKVQLVLSVKMLNLNVGTMYSNVDMEKEN